MAFYHGSDQELAMGTTLKPYLHDEVVVDSAEHLAEELALMSFDLFRPKDALSRQEAIYLAERPEDCKGLGAWGDKIYEVEPIGEVVRYNSGWFDAVYDEVLGHAVEEWERGNGAYGAWVNIYPHEWPSAKVEAMCRAYWAQEAAPTKGYPFKWEYLCREARVVTKVEEPAVEVAL